MSGVAKFLLWLIGVPLACYIIFDSDLVYISGYKPFRGKKFSSAAWKGTDSDSKNNLVWNESYRCGMYTDLVNNHIKKGMTLTQIEELVGQTNLIQYCIYKDIKCMAYSMGTCYAGYGVAHGWLEVCFDKSHKVVSAGRSVNNSEYGKEVCNENLISCYLKGCHCYFAKSKKWEDCPFEIQRW
jgi:hypothetical protein